MRVGLRLCWGLAAAYLAMALLTWLFFVTFDPSLREDMHQLLAVVFAGGAVLAAPALLGSALVLVWLWRRKARLRWWGAPVLGAVMAGPFSLVGFWMLSAVIGKPWLVFSFEDAPLSALFVLLGALGGLIGCGAAFGLRVEVQLGQ